MSSKDEQPKHIDRELDLSNAGRGVWLVKVPKYIAAKWEKAAGSSDVGKLTIAKPLRGPAEVSLTLSDSLMNASTDANIPKKHRLEVTKVTAQMLGVFSRTLRKYLSVPASAIGWIYV